MRSIPEPLAAVIGDTPAELVWHNEVGGLTFELRDTSQRRFLKWAPAGSGLDLQAEIERLGWLAGRWPAPHVVSHGSARAGAWMVTTAVPGESAVSARWKAEPDVAVRAIGAGLRAMHDALPVDECPFSWTAEVRIEAVQRRARTGQIDPSKWHSDHHDLALADAMAVAVTPPPVDRLVVCHGDACAPNTLIEADGTWSGHVDFDTLGVADRWADLAVASWSTEWNYGPGWEGELLAAYGVDPDAHRIAYYRLLWDLG
jgi:kanamycin kinase